MPRRRRSDVDWYVEMSEWLERREHRRKWIVLAVCVAVPLFLMGAGVLAIALKEKGYLRLPGWFKRSATSIEESGDAKPVALGPIVVERIIDSGVKFARLGGDGLPTTITYFFKEVPLDLPSAAKGKQANTGFIINRKTQTEGTLERYNLVNVATGESFKFDDVPVSRIDENAGWTITEEGWRQVHTQLRARMQQDLSQPIFQ